MRKVNFVAVHLLERYRAQYCLQRVWTRCASHGVKYNMPLCFWVPDQAMLHVTEVEAPGPRQSCITLATISPARTLCWLRTALHDASLQSDVCFNFWGPRSFSWMCGGTLMWDVKTCCFRLEGSPKRGQNTWVFLFIIRFASRRDKVVKGCRQLHVGEPVTIRCTFLGLSDHLIRNLYLLSLLTVVIVNCIVRVTPAVFPDSSLPLLDILHFECRIILWSFWSLIWSWALSSNGSKHHTLMSLTAPFHTIRDPNWHKALKSADDGTFH